ncbi:MAG TPA: decaprenyl-phosphate phosphoribosyltransferase [Acidimicrobiales bacterium]|nr:decaprenyl-phosphate phosphoribosyltransferase [Acidimicrobiales bacterium]
MTSSAAKARGPLRALLSAMRIPQWVKNGLIVIAPASAGILTHADVMRHTAVAFISFCLISSAGYLVNDLRDREADRQHPTKRNRAIASGQLSPAHARAAAAILLVVGFILPLDLWHPEGLLLILGLYVVITLSYIYWLKDVAIVEFAALASGFFLRAYAGAAASHVFVSTWFLMVISFGALFLVVGKRSSELKHLGAGSTRKVLAEYSAEFLASALTLSATAVVTGYCLWAFDTSATGLSSIHHNIVPIRLSVIPVVVATLFIMRSAEAGDGAAPEELMLRNRTIQVLAVVWALLLVLGVYA